jgi:hypothetical protein
MLKQLQLLYGEALDIAEHAKLNCDRHTHVCGSSAQLDCNVHGTTIQHAKEHSGVLLHQIKPDSH